MGSALCSLATTLRFIHNSQRLRWGPYLLSDGVASVSNVPLDEGELMRRNHGFAVTNMVMVYGRFCAEGIISSIRITKKTFAKLWLLLV